MLDTTSATLTGTHDEHMSVSPTAHQHSSQLAAGGAQQGAEPPQRGPGDGLPRSIFVADDAPIHMVPTSVISRPLIPELDEAKVVDFMNKMQEGVELTPIEVAWVQVAPETNFYFAFGGCHRWEAAKRLRLATIPAKVIRVAPAVINTYLGASSPFRQRQ